MLQLPDVSLGELYSLLGERDVRIYQLEKTINSLTPNSVPSPTTSAPPKKDPFKKDK